MDGYDERDWGTGLRALGAAVGIARGVQNLEAEPERAEGQWLRNQVLMRELEGPSPREKFAFEQSKEAWGRRAEQAKTVMTAFSEMAKTASPADRKVLEEHFTRFEALLTPAEREATRMIYNNSVLNPMRKKGEWFDEAAGGAPKVTADPTKDIYGYATQMNGLKEYQRRKTGFMTGQVPQQEKMFGLAEGLFAYVGDDDKVQVLSSADLAASQKAKEFGITPGELVANGGIIRGPEKEMSIGGNSFKMRSVFNAIEGKSMPPEFIPIKTGEKIDVNEEKLKDFAVAWGLKDDKGKTDGSKMYNLMTARLDAGWSIPDTLRTMEGYFPGYHFSIVDPGSFSAWPIWGGYSQGDTETLTYFRGEPVGVTTADGKMLKYYYDHGTSRVYDTDGRVISNSLPSWQSKIGAMTETEVIKEATGGGKVAQKPVGAPKPAPKSGEVKVTGAEDKDEIARQARFEAQTEKIKANFAAALKALEELTSGPGIARVR